MTASVCVMGMPAASEMAIERLSRASMASYMSLPITGMRSLKRSHW